MKPCMYILECSDGSLYTGSTAHLQQRLEKHFSGHGANHTKKRLPVRLVYFEEFDRVSDAYRREIQIQRWTRAIKRALIDANHRELKELAEGKNESHFTKHMSEGE